MYYVLGEVQLIQCLLSLAFVPDPFAVSNSHKILLLSFDPHILAVLVIFFALWCTTKIDTAASL